MKYAIKEYKDKKLLVAGILGHSMYPPSTKMGYWRFLIPENFTPHNVLLLGLGGGTVCKLLLDRFPDVKIVAVEKDTKVAMIAVEHFDLDIKCVKVIFKDAYQFVNEVREESFDLIIIDLFVGDWFSYQTISPIFLNQCKKILKDNGKIVINTINPQWLINQTFPVTVNKQKGNIFYTYTKRLDSKV